MPRDNTIESTGDISPFVWRVVAEAFANGPGGEDAPRPTGEIADYVRERSERGAGWPADLIRAANTDHGVEDLALGAAAVTVRILRELERDGTVESAGPDLWRVAPGYLEKHRYMTGGFLLRFRPRRGRDARWVEQPALPLDQFERRQRLQTSAAAADRGIVELAARLREGGPGLRSLDEAHVCRLVESMAAFGYLGAYPVVTDASGELVLDGRHRLEAAARAGVAAKRRAVRDVRTPEDALRHAWAANEGSVGWSAADRRAVAAALGAAGIDVAALEVQIGRKARRELVADELLRDPLQSDRRVAGLLGVSHPTVAAVRAELESTGKIYQLNERTGADGKTRRAPKSKRIRTAANDETVARMDAAGESRDAIMEATGYSAGTVDTVRAEIKGAAAAAAAAAAEAAAPGTAAEPAPDGPPVAEVTCERCGHRHVCR